MMPKADRNQSNTPNLGTAPWNIRGISRIDLLRAFEALGAFRSSFGGAFVQALRFMFGPSSGELCLDFWPQRAYTFANFVGLWGSCWALLGRVVLGFLAAGGGAAVWFGAGLGRVLLGLLTAAGGAAVWLAASLGRALLGFLAAGGRAAVRLGAALGELCLGPWPQKVAQLYV